MVNKAPAKNKTKKSERKEEVSVAYHPSEEPLDFYVGEQPASYGEPKPFTVYYSSPEPSVRLLNGNCVNILNRARPNSVDMIFADPPYFLSNGGITCHAGRMVSVNKGAWDKSSRGEEHKLEMLPWERLGQ